MTDTDYTPKEQYICFLLPPHPRGPENGPYLGIETSEEFYKDGFHSISYDGLRNEEEIEIGIYIMNKFHLAEEMENLYSPDDNMTIEQCLELVDADPHFTVVPTPPGVHV